MCRIVCSGLQMEQVYAHAFEKYQKEVAAKAAQFNAEQTIAEYERLAGKNAESTQKRPRSCFR